MEGRRRRGRPKYTVLDISKVEEVSVGDVSGKEEAGALGSEEEVKEKDIKVNEDNIGQEAETSERYIVEGEKENRTDPDSMETVYSEDFAGDLDFDENLWEGDEEERGRKRDKEAEYHLFVKTHQKRRHRGTRHRARSSS